MTLSPIVLTVAASTLGAPNPTTSTFTFEIMADRGTGLAVNDAGTAVGSGLVDPSNPGFAGFAWTVENGITVLPSPNNTVGVMFPLALSESGIVGGWFRPMGGQQNDEHAIGIPADYSQCTVLSNLDYGAAYAIDDATGTFYGEALVGPRKAFSFGTIDAPLASEILPGTDGVDVQAFGGGFVLGAVELNAAILMGTDSFVKLPDPGIIYEPGPALSYTVAMNESGQFAGRLAQYNQFGNTQERVVFWESIDAEAQVLPQLSQAFEINTPYDMNNDGVIVGSVLNQSVGPNDRRAVIWVDGQPHDLNELVELPDNIKLIIASDINNDGMIVGDFIDLTLPPGSSVGAFALIPPPIEPCPEDLDGSGSIDTADLNIVLGDFACTTDCAGDIDGDGTTGSADLNAILALFGAACD